jgi:hypothetical protein
MMKQTSLMCLALAACLGSASAQSKHDVSSRFASYEGRVMCGYQGWFRAPGDGANEGWGHYAARGKFDSEHVHLDFWPDVAEYEKTYPTALTNVDGTAARVFSSWDESTTDLLFRWMKAPPFSSAPTSYPEGPDCVISRAWPPTTISG